MISTRGFGDAEGAAIPRLPHYGCAAVCLFLLWGSILAAEAARAQPQPDFAQQVEDRIVDLVNAVRAERGLHALERERRLGQTAEYFAAYMARTGRLEHDADGGTPATRVTQHGYGYCAVAENIAYEYNSRGFTAERLARDFVEGWRESVTHRANMLDRAVTQTGVGVARGAGGEYFAAQLFARPQVTTAGKRARCPR